MTHKVAIIGAGPAGIAAAIQLKRSGIKFTLFEAKQPNSLLKNAWSVENYLGIAQSLSGIKLLKKFYDSLDKHGIKTVPSSVQSLDYKGNCFELKAADKTYHFDFVIVASGTEPKLKRQGIFSEVLPLLHKRGKTIVVIGGGDAAFDKALNLARHNKVIICNRSSCEKALPLLVGKALKDRNISYHRNCCLNSFRPDKKRLKISLLYGNKKSCVEADHILQAVGRVPQKTFYTDNLKLHETRLIRQGKLFLAGDVKNARYRQVAIAVGDGIMAAMKICHKLQKSRVRNNK